MIPAHPQNDVRKIYDEAASRYDWQHAILTAGADNRGRRWLINKTVGPGIHILDAGSGTGSTGIAAARIAGKNGSVTFYDLSPGMLEIAGKKAQKSNIDCPFFFETGDLHQLPFSDNHFNTVLSTYSLDPLSYPLKAFSELYRVTKPGGLIGVAHETAPQKNFLDSISKSIEHLIWYLPKLSLACRPIEILSHLNEYKGHLVDQKRIGVPLWPFQLFIFRKKL